MSSSKMYSQSPPPVDAPDVRLGLGTSEGVPDHSLCRNWRLARRTKRMNRASWLPRVVSPPLRALRHVLTGRTFVLVFASSVVALSCSGCGNLPLGGDGERPETPFEAMGYLVGGEAIPLMMPNDVPAGFVYDGFSWEPDSSFFQISFFGPNDPVTKAKESVVVCASAVQEDVSECSSVTRPVDREGQVIYFSVACEIEGHESCPKRDLASEWLPLITPDVPTEDGLTYFGD